MRIKNFMACHYVPPGNAATAARHQPSSGASPGGGGRSGVPS